MSFATKIPVQTLVAGVHAYEVPNFESDLISIHLEDLILEVRPDRALVVLFKEVTYETVHYRCLPNGGIAQHNYFEG